MEAGAQTRGRPICFWDGRLDGGGGSNKGVADLDSTFRCVLFSFWLPMGFLGLTRCVLLLVVPLARPMKRTYKASPTRVRTPSGTSPKKWETPG